MPPVTPFASIVPVCGTSAASGLTAVNVTPAARSPALPATAADTPIDKVPLLAIVPLLMVL